jgi:DNA-binding transcriptional LysR family regulator
LVRGDDLDEVLAFLAVVEEQSFAAAARTLQRDSSVVSRRVTALETRLGVRLLERSTRHTAPTEAGQLYYRRMRGAVAAMEDADVEVTHASAAATGVLRLALPATFGRRWIAPYLPEFLAAYPSLSLQVEFSDRVVDLVEERFDLAVRVGDLNDSRLVARKVAANERILVAAPLYLDRCGRPEAPADLALHACIANSRYERHLDWTLVRGDEARDVRVQSRMTSDDPDSLLMAAVAGAGIMVSATWLCFEDMREGRLVRVLPAWRYGRSGDIHLLRPSARHTPAKTRVFSDWAAALMARMPWT